MRPPAGAARLGLVLLALLVTACSHDLRSAPRAGAADHDRRSGAAGGFVEEGWASYYGAELAGRRTASGERYDPRRLTAAHRTLPLGTCLDVQRVEGGRRVRVRVNDRGPYVRGRILDVSEGAARELGMIQRGVARVRLETCPAR